MTPSSILKKIQSQRRNTKAQFSIRNMLLWTAIVTGGITIVAATPWDLLSPLSHAFYLSFYAMFVCGSLSFSRDPKSFDIWFPTGMTGFTLLPWLMLQV